MAILAGILTFLIMGALVAFLIAFFRVPADRTPAGLAAAAGDKLRNVIQPAAAAA